MVTVLRTTVGPSPWVRIRSGEKSSVKSPLPMWKLTGSSAAWAAAQSGSQWRSPSSGIPNLWGSPVKRTPLCPSFAQRSISATLASTSQKGVAMIGTKRRGSGSIQSSRKSL
jgi:hypothetical protein